MSMHKIPLTDIERAGLQKHGLDIGKPSQLSDVFRQGVAHGLLAQPEVTKMVIPPPQAEMMDVIYAEGWNAACDAYFGGLPPQEPLIVTIENNTTAPFTPITADMVTDSVADKFESSCNINTDSFNFIVAAAVNAFMPSYMGAKK